MRDKLPLCFEDQVLPIEGASADAWGSMVAGSEVSGKPMRAMEAFIAATAEVHELTLVTRNASRFDPLLEALINPWTGP